MKVYLINKLMHDSNSNIWYPVTKRIFDSMEKAKEYVETKFLTPRTDESNYCFYETMDYDAIEITAMEVE